MTIINQATRAASHAAGAGVAVSLLDARTIPEIADILSESLFPPEIRNGIYLDPDAYREGIAVGLAKVKEIAASDCGGGWVSRDPSQDFSEIEDAIMAGYFGA